MLHPECEIFCLFRETNKLLVQFMNCVNNCTFNEPDTNKLCSVHEFGNYTFFCIILLKIISNFLLNTSQ